MDSQTAIEASGNVVEYARRSGQAALALEMMLDITGQAVWGSTPVPQAIVRWQQAMDAASGDPRSRAKLLCVLGVLKAMQGEMEEAHTLRSQSDSIDADLGSRTDVFFQAQFWSVVDTISGDYAKAEDVLRNSIAGLDPETHMVDINRDMMALAILAQGRYDEADELALQSQQSTTLPSDAFGAGWRRIRARVLAHRGEHEEAVRLAREASALMATTDYLPDTADTEYDLAIVLRATSDHDGAIEAVTHAIDVWDRKGIAVLPDRARAEFGLAPAD